MDDILYATVEWVVQANIDYYTIILSISGCKQSSCDYTQAAVRGVVFLKESANYSNYIFLIWRVRICLITRGISYAKVILVSNFLVRANRWLRNHFNQRQSMLVSSWYKFVPLIMLLFLHPILLKKLTLKDKSCYNIP